MQRHAFLLVIFSSYVIRAHCAYFTMTDVQVNIPGNKSSLLANNYPIVTMYAQNDHPLHKRDLIRYSFVRDGEDLLKIYHPAGDILFTSNFLEDTIRNITHIEMEVSAVDSSGSDNTTFQVNITPPNILDCDLIVQDLCYWQSATYNVLENRGSSAIGSLSSPYLAEMCKGYNVSYEIVEGESHFALIPSTLTKTWNLQTIKSLDRDIRRLPQNYTKSYGTGQTVNVAIDCNVINAQGTERNIPKNFSVNVLDEDDNAPFAHNNATVEVLLDRNVAVKGHLLHYIFYDVDSPEVNKYDIRLLNDSEDLLREKCDIHVDDRDGENQTVIGCSISFSRDAVLPTLPYRFVLQVNDTSLLEGHGSSTVEQVFEIALKKSFKRRPKFIKEDNLPPLLIYPARDVEIFRTASPYARVTQPDHRNRDDAVNFTIRADRSKHHKALNITKSEGIVYVSDVDALREHDRITLVIEWTRSNGISESDEIYVNIIDETINICSNKSSHVNDWEHCGGFGGSRECEEACGLGTGGTPNLKRRIIHNKRNRCAWINGKQMNKANLGISYSTCSPDPVTCPDMICDALEKLHDLICPQDCSKASSPMFFKNGNGDANEVCTCDVTANCACMPKFPKITTQGSLKRPTYIISSSLPPLVGRHTGSAIGSCGTTCMIGILAGVIFLLGAVGVVVICWRLDRFQKMGRGKFGEEGQDLSAPLSDYVDRTALQDTLHVNFDMITILNSQENKLAPDPKWEFPRNQLIIEQTLGEGEFGRVLRARAKDIAGQPGYTTVAVKTLKEDARQGELSDLLSEYELLKEVSHPNVIRLLGASTIPGGPVYLIIEFAQYGSLRSYLRRSRHLKSEYHAAIDIPPDDFDPQQHYDHPNTNKVTPKDILSFAWQISNGMSYLSEVKLVHRDLAARNVLLAAGKICKISDFGLTRDIYEDDAYFKRSKGRVPVKWMAPESLSDHLYTSKSDVWSFGILVWELVTLGATPYPGVPIQNLFHLLRQGYRMERPENCSPALYKVMRSCWHIDPVERPEFSELASKFEKMLSDGIEYLDLSTNIIHNRSYFCANLDGDEQNTQLTNNNKESLASSINYLEKLQSYVKCGESDKELEPVLDHKVDGSSPAKGYESPIKFDKSKSTRPKTPTNESPQYYTNMTAQQK